MAENRVTSLGAEVLRDGAPNARVSTLGAEVLRGGAPSAIVSGLYIEVLRSVAVNTSAHTDIFTGSLLITGYAPTISIGQIVDTGHLILHGEALHDILVTDILTGHLEITSGVFTSSLASTMDTGHGYITSTIFYKSTSFASEAAIMALAEVESSARISEGAVMAAVSIYPEARASEAAILIAGEIVPGARVGQAAVMVLADAQPCVTERCQLWKIVRKDGVVLRFAGLDVDVTWGSDVYKACGSLLDSASEASSTIESVANMELTGVLGRLDSDEITEEDLYAGLYDDAFVTVWLVSYADPSDTPKRLAAGHTGTLTHGEDGFNTEVLGVSDRMEQNALVLPVTPGCRWKFGGPECGVDKEALAISGTTLASVRRDIISADIDAVSSDGFYSPNSEIRYDAGKNAGYTAEVKSIDFDTGEITLWDGLPFIPEYGDTFTVVPGCPNTVHGCHNYDNYERYGGFPDLPGLDGMSKTPEAKY